MKKLLLVSMIVLTCSISFGQIGFGIKGAVTVSSLSTDVSDYANAAKLGYQLGAFVRIGEKLHLQPEIYFGMKRGELKFSSMGLDPQNPTKSVDVKQDMTLSTIDIPVLLGYRILKVPAVGVRIQAGPVASIVANKKFAVSFDGVDQPEDQSPIEKSSLKDINWGLQMGAGVDVLFLQSISGMSWV